MAKLTRLTAKVFGETADGTLQDPEIGQFGSAKAGTYNGTGDVATIQSLSAWSNGWIDSVTPTQQFPPLPEMTGVHKVMSYQEAYLLQEGIPEWDNGTTYYKNSIVKESGTYKLYGSIIDNNTGNILSDSTKWLFLADLSSLIMVAKTPFSINSCNTLNGQADILFAPGSGTQEVVVSDSTTAAVSTNNSGSDTKTITFGTPKSLTNASAVLTVYPAWNGSAICTLSATLGDDSNVQLGQLYRNATNIMESVTINYDFGSPTTVKSLTLYCYVSGVGSASIGSVSYTESISVSTADTLYFNIGGGQYPNLVGTTAQGKNITISSLDGIDVSAYADGIYNGFINEDGTVNFYNNTLSYQAKIPSTPSSNDIWLDTSKEPLVSYKYDGADWEEYEGIPIGSITVTSGVITGVKQPSQNSNLYNITNTKADRQEVISWGMPDYKNGQNITLSGTNVWRTVTQNVFLVYTGRSAYGCTLYLKDEEGTLIPNSIIPGAVDGFGGVGAIESGVFIPKGYSYSADLTVNFVEYPLKGAN